jgi:hypothetical protein
VVAAVQALRWLLLLLPKGVLLEVVAQWLPQRMQLLIWGVWLR